MAADFADYALLPEKCEGNWDSKSSRESRGANLFAILRRAENPRKSLVAGAGVCGAAGCDFSLGGALLAGMDRSCALAGGDFARAERGFRTIAITA